MTLVEMMITVTVMGFVIAGVLSANFFGLREDRLMESKAGANDTARKGINSIFYDIRSAKGFDVGNMSGTNFVAISNGVAMQGGAVRLYMTVIGTNETVNLTRYILYYYDSGQAASDNGKLWRFNSTNGSATVIVSNLAPPLNFTCEDYLGNTQSVRTYKGVVHTTLQLLQFQYPLTAVGTNGLYDHYKIDVRATPHLPDGQ